MRTDRQTIQKLDSELVEIIRDCLILTPLSWPKDTMRQFLAGVKKQQYRLPQVTFPKTDYSAKIATLKAYITSLGKDAHPAIAFLRDTAESYLDAYYILQGAGTKDVSEFSRKLYGSPKDVLPGYKRRNIQVAKYFLGVVEDYRCSVSEEPMVYTAGAFRKALQRHIHKTIHAGENTIAVTVDSQITARATAGPNYVKIRRGAQFSEVDLQQLLHHEVMVHTLTYMNGRNQPVLKSLGYAAPRTTSTQEGLAVFAEYINLSIELVRLKRIALRILAIDMAERGADLIDLFRFFREHRQDNEESYYSAMRIFRGGLPEGGIVFYKDNVYLRGLIEVEAFLKRAMHEGILHNIDLLFAGKLTTEDISRLEPLVEQGYISEPLYIPQWAKRSSELAAHLAFNDLTERFRLKAKDKADNKQ